MSASPIIVDLCRLLGVETDYIDNGGVRREPPPATITALVAALGYPGATRGEAEASIALFHRRTAARLVEPVVVRRKDEQSSWTIVTQPAGSDDRHLRWVLEAETGGISQGEARFADLPLAESIAVGRQIYERRRLVLPVPLQCGYHRARVEFADAVAEGALIVVPRRAYQPPTLDGGCGIWGLASQLYGLRSERNWGIGDFTDLADLLRHAAAAGAGAISLNPLHALFLDDPQAASPYSPSSRLFSNPLYLDVEAIDDFAECAEARALSASSEWRAALRRLRGGELVDYVEVTERKFEILERLYRSFRANHMPASGERAGEFQAFQAREGLALQRFATHCALRKALAETGASWRSWSDWPVELRDPAGPAVAQFMQENQTSIEFFAYLQWQCDRQLAGCADVARRLGMPIGLYHDLAVGVDANGAEAWGNQAAIVPGWSIGAPPDPWNMKGQSWGLPPFDPVALRALAYEPLVQTFRANMRHAGALRIDHILGFRRLFWIPAGAPPTDGAYVRYPFDDIVGILALESERHRCLIIGEDLGTLPEGLREALADVGVLSYRLLYFEREQDGAFRRPDAYPRQALVAIGTHDLPTLPAYWAAADVALKLRLGFYSSDEERRQDEERRRRDRHLLVEALRRAGLFECVDLETGDAPPVEAAYRFLARTPSRLLMVHLEDALGIMEQINLPGTVLEHPNWRRRLPLAVDELFGEPRVRRLLRALAAERPRVDARNAR
jgi:4-alpha-glucanotransferase